MADFLVGNVTPSVGNIKVGTRDVNRIMNGVTEVWPLTAPLITYNSVLNTPSGCGASTGTAISIRNTPASSIAIGYALEELSGGSYISLRAGIFRMSRDLIPGNTYNTSDVFKSTYIITVGSGGVITNKQEC
jgi:hypothetical protein